MASSARAFHVDVEMEEDTEEGERNGFVYKWRIRDWNGEKECVILWRSDNSVDEERERERERERDVCDGADFADINIGGDEEDSYDFQSSRRIFRCSETQCQ